MTTKNNRSDGPPLRKSTMDAVEADAVGRPQPGESERSRGRYEGLTNDPIGTAPGAHRRNVDETDGRLTLDSASLARTLPIGCATSDGTAGCRCTTEALP